MKSINEILHRIQKLPKKMTILDTKVPKKVRDPKNGKLIDDPHGRTMQTRQDIVDSEDPYSKPIIHFHNYPDHMAYEQNWREYAEIFVNIRSDVEFLIDRINKLEGELHGN